MSRKLTASSLRKTEIEREGGREKRKRRDRWTTPEISVFGSPMFISVILNNLDILSASIKPVARNHEYNSIQTSVLMLR